MSKESTLLLWVIEVVPEEVDEEVEEAWVTRS